MIKVKTYTKEGNQGKEMEIPSFFNEKVREDIISKALEAKKAEHPYGPSPVAGKQHSASGKLRHRKSVFKSIIGRGSSRVPRKILMNRGEQFHWEAAAVPNARGGRRAHPPKPLSKMNIPKLNKKEAKKALTSSISASADLKEIDKKYETLDKDELKNLNFPIVIESKFDSVKTKEMNNSLKNILGEGVYKKLVKKKKERSGKGKNRGRRYKENAGLLLVTGSEEDVKNQAIEVVKANELGINDLARGGPGRLTIYTEKAVQELSEKINGSRDSDKSSNKSSKKNNKK